MDARGALNATIEFLRQRKVNYQLAFGVARVRVTARAKFRAVFGGPAGQEVLRDLAKFCRASEPCWHADPRQHAVLEGRREVWLRIENHTRLKVHELYAIYGNTNFPVTEEDDG